MTKSSELNYWHTWHILHIPQPRRYAYNCVIVSLTNTANNMSDETPTWRTLHTATKLKQNQKDTTKDKTIPTLTQYLQKYND